MGDIQFCLGSDGHQLVVEARQQVERAVGYGHLWLLGKVGDTKPGSVCPAFLQKRHRGTEQET